jgi:hypothetical protein
MPLSSWASHRGGLHCWPRPACPASQATHFRCLFHQCPERLRHAPPEERCHRRSDLTGATRPRGIRGRDGGVHQHAGTAVAGHHTGIASFALVGNAIEVENRTQWLIPRLAAPDIEVPVQIKVLVAADAGNRLLLAPHKAAKAAGGVAEVGDGTSQIAGSLRSSIAGGDCDRPSLSRLRNEQNRRSPSVSRAPAARWAAAESSWVPYWAPYCRD